MTTQMARPAEPAKEAKTEGEDEERKIPQIATAKVTKNYDGMVFGEWFIRAPEGLTVQDLNDHPVEVWKAVQGNRNTALRKFDRIVLVDYDEQWMLEATVSAANPSTVTLAKPRITQLPARLESLYEDHTYAVRWAGSGFAIYRKRDDVAMNGGATYHTAAVARDELNKLYPTKREAA